MSWEQLLGIVQEARDIDAEEKTRKPSVCPNDFTPLQEAGNGVLHCPWDGWQYPRDA